MRGDSQEEAASRMAEQRKRPVHKRDWLEIIGKLGAPLAAIIAALAAALIANSFQRQMSGATLLSEREQAESRLRADMFASLITPIIGPQKSISPDKEQLLVELLALNFHEHFELKPLLERVDQRLETEKRDEESRRSLQSIVRRIIDRQIAGLQKESGGKGSDMGGAQVHSFSITEKVQNDKQQEIFRMLDAGGKKAYQVEDDETRRIISPDQKHMLTLRVMEPDWQNKKFKVQVFNAFSSASPGSLGRSDNYKREMITQMNVSWADLPFTDNTLFPDGNRFAVVMYDVQPYCEEGEEPYYEKNELHCAKGKPFKTATIKFVWFPKNYYTPRERPIEQDELLKLIGKKPHWWNRLIQR